MSEEKLNGLYVVKPWDLMVEEYWVNSNGSININPYFTDHMERNLDFGRVIDIEDGVWKSPDGVKWNISEDMLLGPYFKWGEKCLVREDESEKWEVKLFVAYSPGHEYYIGCKDAAYKYVKRREDKQEKESRQEVFDKSGELIGYFIPKEEGK